MNILQWEYAIEVARLSSINKAAEKLLVAPPNLSRAIRELEEDLGIVIFNRSYKGMTLTPEGENFIGYAKRIIGQIDEVEYMYKSGASVKQKFSVSVPRASYISDAFARFSTCVSAEQAEIYYNETSSLHTMDSVISSEYDLGIVRYAKKFDKYFEKSFEEKGLLYELITDFHYVLIMNRDSPLAAQDAIRLSDLTPFIEIANADPFVPSLALSAVRKEELPEEIKRRIFVFERASQFSLLLHNKETFMWVSPVPNQLLEQFQLVQKECADNRKTYRDVLVHRKDYPLSELDRRFITELIRAKRRCLP